ncbi:DUF5682 family protein [Cardiobacterium hominis]
MTTRLFGIRHHGAGSARHLIAALREYQPDCILLEGPPEADALLPLAAEADMQPPVALLAYRPDAPQQAVYYPFAAFSPEWQAMRYAAQAGIPLQFCDLPLAHSLYKEETPDDSDENAAEDAAPEDDEIDSEDGGEAEDEDTAEEPRHSDPFDELAAIAGLPDGEAFWEALVEQRRDSTEIFAAVAEAVSALREARGDTDPRDALREAWMRKTLRQAEKTYRRIAVVCGAWHVSALAAKIAAKDDNALLKGLPKTKVDCTWIPWTHSRLSLKSGYGAGLAAPGWYAHLWAHPDDDGVRWIGRAAALLRAQGHDISAAHVIETVRLANASAALRGQSQPRLADHLEALTAIVGMGDDTVLRLIEHEWLIDNAIGSVPAATPQLPLIADVQAQRKKLRLAESDEAKTLELDLRKPLDLQRSIHFHRLQLLGITDAETLPARGKGTFKEAWTYRYQPESHITRHIADLSATQDNLADSLAALPNLTDTVRYGDVRALDPAPLLAVLDTLLARLAAGGVQGCLNIDHDSASALFTPIRQADYQLSLLDNPALNTYWQRFLQNILAATNAHPLLAGNAARLLFDKQHLDADRCAELLAQNLSAANPSERAAYWLEGYLYQSGTVLLLHDPLWRILDDWLRALSAEHFTELLPLLRRTFSSFEPGERRQLGDKAREHAGDTPATTNPVAAAKPEHHAGHGLAALQTVAAWLNLDVGAVSEA